MTWLSRRLFRCVIVRTPRPIARRARLGLEVCERRDHPNDLLALGSAAGLLAGTDPLVALLGRSGPVARAISAGDLAADLPLPTPAIVAADPPAVHRPMVFSGSAGPVSWAGPRTWWADDVLASPGGTAGGVRITPGETAALTRPGSLNSAGPAANPAGPPRPSAGSSGAPGGSVAAHSEGAEASAGPLPGSFLAGRTVAPSARSTGVSSPTPSPSSIGTPSTPRPDADATGATDATPRPTPARVWVEGVRPDDPAADGTGGFRVWRDGTAGDLAVEYALEIGAGPGSTRTVGRVVITDGNRSAAVVPGGQDAPGRTAALTLTPGPGYAVGTPAASVPLGTGAPTPSLPARPAGLPAPRAAGGPVGLSAHPIRYWDGMVVYQADDLASAGFGQPWGVSRAWANLDAYDDRGDFGSGWAASDQPYLVTDAGTGVVSVVLDGITAVQFSPTGGGGYTSLYFTTLQLRHDSAAAEFVLTDADGTASRFWNFSAAGAKPGRLKQQTDPYGNTTTVTTWTAAGRPGEVQRSGTDAGATVTESYLYAYGTGGRLDSVTLRRQVGVGAWATVRKVDYAYYGTAEAHGNNGDLKTATVRDAAGTALATEYYRYYAGESGGYARGLKYAFRADSYARLAVAFADPTTATDAQAASYADHYFEYDASRRATKEVAKAAGSGGTYGGQGTYTYAYTAAAITPTAINNWAMKTVETLPDGNTNTVYSNLGGEVLLSAYTDAATSAKWVTAYRYDTAGRLLWTAYPSAVTGYSDAYADLLNVTLGSSSYLRDAAGLFDTYSYYTSTTATATTAGGVTQYLQQAGARQGELGTVVPQVGVTYFSRTSGVVAIYPTAAATRYRNTDGTGGQATTYSYTWPTSGFGPTQVTTTLPVVTTGQNGPGAATSTTTAYDTLGRPAWAKDAGGYLSYAQYDLATGAAVKAIADVDTAQTATFAGLPSGWSTPSGGGLHLTTASEVDARGRATKVTAPNGRVDYAVYDDPNHAVRQYPGWTGTATTGPTAVWRDDWANGYTELLTMTAAPAVSGGRPTGGEAVSGVQNLARTAWSAGGQVAQSDAYYDLTGLTYTTSATLGTEGTNFYRTRYGYDAAGRPNRTQSPQGTVYRTVSDGRGRPVSDWAGTDDTPTSGSWSPANTAGTNLVKVREYEYDGGGVGDGNVTKMTEYPGLGGAARVTQTWYDWRNRSVLTKAGVEASESSTVNRSITYLDYDNLGQVTKARVYDGDAVAVTVTGVVPDAPSASLLRAQTGASYDEFGRAYRADTYSVDPSTGAVGSNTLYANTWYDARGLAVKATGPGGLVAKTAYDGAGRPTTVSATDGGGDAAYADADDVTGDAVLQQVTTAYDGSGNVLSTTTKARFHDETATGALGTATTAPKARVSYAGYYYG